MKQAQLMLTNPRDAFRGQSRSTNMVPFHTLGIGFLLVWNSNFVFLCFPIFDFNRNIVHRTHPFWDNWLQKCRDLEIWVSGHSRSLKVVPIDRLGMVSYKSSIVTLSIKRTVFCDNQLKKCHDLEKPGYGSVKVIGNLLPFDRAHRTSYWCSIVTMDLSCIISEIFNVD